MATPLRVGRLPRGERITDPNRRRRPPPLARGLLALLATLLVACSGSAPTSAGAPSDGSVRIVTGGAVTLDPAVTGDQSSSAVIAQLFEGVTAFDPELQVRPALAAGWDVDDGGTTVTFHLRPDLTFSDGTPLGARDVVRSWLRLLDPSAPSPLAGLLEDVVGASAYLAGSGSAADVGIRADGDLDVVVELERPASDFPTIVAGPSFGIVPEGFAGDPVEPAGFVGSGGYVLDERTAEGYRLRANDRYWAGPPAIGTVELVTDLGGRSPVDAFEAGDVDYTPIGSYDASWIAYDDGLGASLRSVPSLSLEYYGFDVETPPFDDPLGRRALASAIDWPRIVELGSGDDAEPARSMVPPGIPGRATGDFGATYDPDLARDLLRRAGYPGGRGFPAVTFTTGSAYAEAAAIGWKDVLGIDVAIETMSDAEYYTALSVDPPQVFAVGWVADYPGPDDFLGILLGTGRANNFGRWSAPEFDAAIARANAAETESARRAAFDEAEAIVAEEAPVIPIAYGTSWALSRDGLLGAADNGLGILRFAGLAWEDGR